MHKRPTHAPVRTVPPRRTAAAAATAALLALLVTATPVHAQAEEGAEVPPRPAGATQRNAAGGHSQALKSRTPVTLNFVNADIEAVTRAMAAMIDRQIMVDPRVRGSITLYSEQALSVREAYLNYLSALRGLGFTVVENAGLLKVVPEADAKLQAGTVSVGPPTQRGDTILTQIFKLNHENPNNLVAVLRPLISPNNTINANPGNNSLIITDYADNLQRISRIIAALDMPSATDIDIVPLKHAVASDIAPLAQRLGDGGGAGAVVPGGVPIAGGGGGVTVLADSRSNALIIRAANPAKLAQLRSIIERLDVPAGGAGPAGQIWVVHLRNADAVKLATVLRAAFGGGGGGGGSVGPGASPAQVAQAAAGQAGPGGASPATAPVGASPQPSTGGSVQADPSTNSLIITAAEPLYRQMRQMIDQLDTRRAQVYIESLIVEVSGDNAADFGFQWQGILGKEGDRNIGLIGTNLPTSTGPGIIDINVAALQGQVNVGNGMNIGLVRNFGGTYALAAIARVLQAQNNTNIMSTPNLITLDNEEAKIVVGRNVPFLTGQFTNTGGGGGATANPFQTIERKDVGLTLRIRPQIGEGGTVRMSIFQESSDVIAQATGTTNAGPTTSKRSIESSVIVDDGQILVLGGLIEDRFTDEKSQIPVLGSLPVVGQLFRSESRSKRRTNLMVFLRPVVLRDGDSATRLSLDRYDVIRAQQAGSQPAPSIFMPVGESPTLPPLAPPPATGAQARPVAPPSAPQ